MPIEFDADQDFYVDLNEYAGGRGDATLSEADPVEIVATLESRLRILGEGNQGLNRLIADLRTEIERLKAGDLTQARVCGDCRKPIREACQCEAHLRICEEQQGREDAERDAEIETNQLYATRDELDVEIERLTQELEATAATLAGLAAEVEANHPHVRADERRWVRQHLLAEAVECPDPEGAHWLREAAVRVARQRSTR